MKLRMSVGFVVACLALAVRAQPPVPPGAAESVPVATLENFMQRVESTLPDDLAQNPKLWRQVAPSVFWLLHDHAQQDGDISGPESDAMAAELARVLLKLRARAASRTVLGSETSVIALLDPDRGLDPRQITTLASAYGTSATVYKQEGAETREDVGEAFLEAVTTLAAAQQPATIIVLGHGMPREIQSYGIPVERLAAALTPDSVDTHDLSALTLIFDDCYSADFSLALAKELEKRATDEKPLVSAPAMIAGTSRCRVGIASVKGKFVPHFWAEVIELLYIRTPRPQTITLDDFLGRIDNAMYGYGRQPLFSRGKIIGYRLTDPEIVQDPVIFVPLTDDDRKELAGVLGVEDPAVLGMVLDVG